MPSPQPTNQAPLPAHQLNETNPAPNRISPENSRVERVRADTNQPGSAPQTSSPTQAGQVRVGGSGQSGPNPRSALKGSRKPQADRKALHVTFDLSNETQPSEKGNLEPVNEESARHQMSKADPIPGERPVTTVSHQTQRRAAPPDQATPSEMVQSYYVQHPRPVAPFNQAPYPHLTTALHTSQFHNPAQLEPHGRTSPRPVTPPLATASFQQVQHARPAAPFNQAPFNHPAPSFYPPQFHPQAWVASRGMISALPTTALAMAYPQQAQHPRPAAPSNQAPYAQQTPAFYPPQPPRPATPPHLMLRPSPAQSPRTDGLTPYGRTSPHPMAPLTSASPQRSTPPRLTPLRESSPSPRPSAINSEGSPGHLAVSPPGHAASSGNRSQPHPRTPTPPRPVAPSNQAPHPQLTRAFYSPQSPHPVTSLNHQPSSRPEALFYQPQFAHPAPPSHLVLRQSPVPSNQVSPRGQAAPYYQVPSPYSMVPLVAASPERLTPPRARAPTPPRLAPHPESSPVPRPSAIQQVGYPANLATTSPRQAASPVKRTQSPPRAPSPHGHHRGITR